MRNNKTANLHLKKWKKRKFYNKKYIGNFTKTPLKKKETNLKKQNKVKINILKKESKTLNN